MNRLEEISPQTKGFISLLVISKAKGHKTWTDFEKVHKCKKGSCLWTDFMNQSEIGS